MKKRTHKLKIITRIIAMTIITLSVMATTTSWQTNTVSAASSISDLQNKYDALEKEQQRIKKELAQIANNKSKAQEKASAVKSQISTTQQQIDVLNYKIEIYNQTIAQKESDAQKKEEEIASYYDAFKKRLKVMYTTSTSSTFEMLLSSKNFTEFLTNTEFVKKVAEYDKNLLAKMENDKQAINDAKAEIQTSKKALVEDKSSIDSKQNSLESQLNQQNKTVASLAQTEQEKQAQRQKITDNLNKLNAEIEEMIKASQVENSYVGGEFLWPVPGYNGISSYYGWRTIDGIRDFHTGIDVAGANIYGKSIVASNDGVVSYVKNLSSGYGKHLMIDHGGGTYTLYGHTSAILVSPGQKVKRGQVVAKVGSTGWSTGPHLHFEIWINKQRVNPLTYFK